MSLWQRLKYLNPRFREAEERDMQEELAALASIAPPGELGNLTRAAEEHRAAWGWTFLEQLFGDLRYAVRTMRRNAVFCALALLSLALRSEEHTSELQSRL